MHQTQLYFTFLEYIDTQLNLGDFRIQFGGGGGKADGSIWKLQIFARRERKEGEQEEKG